MSRYEWLLFLHVLAAFMTVVAVVLFGALVVGTRRGDDGPETTALLRLSGFASLFWNVGGLAVLVFGIWLAVDVDQYEILDAWIIVAVVLWVIASAAGGPLGAGFAGRLKAAREGGDATVAPAGRLAALYGVLALATTALLVVMIFKPGAS